jgi:hypothetical protein
VLLAIAVLSAAFLLLPAGSAQVPIVSSISGPNAVALGQVTAYNLTIGGGPSGRVNYTIHWYVTGPEAAGAVPSASSPSTLTGNRTTFRLNITAPTKEQTIQVVAKVSVLVGGTYENASVEKAVVVITAVTLSGTFRNLGPTAALNVTVRFYVDNVLAGTRTLARIEPNGQATTSFPYLPVGLQPGTHQVRIEADLDGNGVIDPSRGETVVSELFYKGTPPLSTGWTVLIGIAVFVPVLIATIALRRRQRA